MTIRPPAFIFHNGRSARSARDLLTILEEGPTDLWSDHVTLGPSPRNDFASWAEHALREPVLAARLRDVATREATLEALKQWLEPHITRSASFHGYNAKEFFVGLGIGIIIGIIIMNIVLLA